jgi:putative hydrolase of the HAD superfamily
MAAIEAVTLDLDGTLVEYVRSPGEVLQDSFESVGTEPLFSVEAYYARYDEFAEQCDAMDELRAECFATLVAENGYEETLGREVATAYAAERDQSNVELLPGVEQALDELSRRYQLAIITNGARDAQRQKIEAVGLDRWVETVTIASDDTAPKPDPEPFERTIQELDTDPATTVHVGDSLETDIAGASRSGLESVWIADGTGSGEHEPTYRVSAPRELRFPPWESESKDS